MSSSERVLSFGGSGSLHGVLTEPAPEDRLDGVPAVLFWNVGTNHHVGPHRVYVDLARRLAQLGFTSLRFDTSGLGDSAASRDDTRPDAERNVADVREAMLTVKKQRGFERFVLVGFCSSVDAAHAVGVAGARRPTEAGGRKVGLRQADEEALQSRRLAGQDQEQAGGEGIERARVACFHAALAAHLGDHVM